MIIDPSSRPPATLGSWLAWTLCALVVVLAAAGPVLSISGAGAILGPWDIGNRVLNAMWAIAFSVVGTLIVSRQPHNTIGWLLMFIGCSFAFSVTVLGHWSQSLPASPALTFTTLLLAWLSGWSWWLLIGPLLLILLLFSKGRLLSPRWTWVVVVLAASFSIFLLFATFSTTFTLPNSTEPTPNPLGFLPDAVAQIFLVLFQLSLVATVVSCLAAIFVRYRRAGAVEREQIKWFLYACRLFGVVFALQIFHQLNATRASHSVACPLPFSARLPIPVSMSCVGRNTQRPQCKVIAGRIERKRHRQARAVGEVIDVDGDGIAASGQIVRQGQVERLDDHLVGAPQVGGVGSA
jgi:hypothetical protein